MESLERRYGRIHLPPESAGGSGIPASLSRGSHDTRWWDGFGLPVINGEVGCAVEISGNVVVGGSFTTACDVVVNNVALWDGARWRPLGSGVNGPVVSLAVLGADLIAAGPFTEAGGVPAAGIARWDGSSWHPLGSGIDGRAAALAVQGSSLFVGGTFSTTGGVPAHNLARWDGIEWTEFGGGVNGAVRAVAVRGDRIYVGGAFDFAGNTSASGIAVWDGGWSALGTGVRRNYAPGTVQAIVPWGDSLLIGGSFDQVGALSTRNVGLWNGNEWESLGQGPSGTLRALAIHEGAPIAGGAMAGGGLVRWNGQYWEPFHPTTSWSVSALATSGPDLIACGQFCAHNSPSTPAAFNVARLSGGIWHSFEMWTDRMHGLITSNGGSGQVRALAVHRNTIAAAGTFTYAADPIVWSEVRGLGRWDLSHWSGWSTFPGSGPIETFLSVEDTLYAGGSFYDGFSNARVPVYRFDGAGWSAMDTLTAEITCMARFKGDLYAGASALWNDPGVAGLYRWAGDHWALVGPLEHSASGTAILALAEHRGELIASGLFERVDGVLSPNVAAWNGSAWRALGAGLQGGNSYEVPVLCLASHQSDLYAGTVLGVSRWDGATWSALGSEPIHNVWALASFAGELFAGGYLWWVDDPPKVDGVARWDGSKWRALGSGTDGPVVSFARIGRSVYMGGAFDVAGGHGSFGIARWDGLSDPPVGHGKPRVHFSQASPNPFRNGTDFTYRVVSEGRVRIEIFDLSGRRVALLLDRVQSPGLYTTSWNGRGEGGRTLSAGVYFAHMEHPGGIEKTQKVVRLR